MTPTIAPSPEGVHDLSRRRERPCDPIGMDDQIGKLDERSEILRGAAKPLRNQALGRMRVIFDPSSPSPAISPFWPNGKA
jgi:hypothetical protein